MQNVFDAIIIRPATAEQGYLENKLPIITIYDVKFEGGKYEKLGGRGRNRGKMRRGNGEG